LSASEIIAVLYYHTLRIDPSDPAWPDRDRFVLSKGHAAPVLYAALADLGFFPKEELSSLRQIDSILQGHPDMIKTPGIDMSTGSLGQGLSAAIGMALAGRLDGKDYHVWTLLGDGELNEGQVWEAAAFASFHKLSNLTAIVDVNCVQLDGPTECVLCMEPLADKWKAFGWNVIEVDGHSVRELLEIVDMVTKRRRELPDESRPTVILARTVKGKGVSFMENQASWHGAVPNIHEFQRAMEELGGVLDDIANYA
ncbi:MAG TPA: transketolase, partial [Bacillota bacterium]|nr:transketolase [Bacillota bacterium]